MSKDDYDDQLRDLQIALVKYQQWAIERDAKALVIFEGRDGAGKDGTIARITEHLAPRNTRVISLPKPSDRERSQWYFQRYVAHLPAAGELVIFNRSWYNRGGRRAGHGLLHARGARGLPARRYRRSSGCSRKRTSGWSRSGSTSPRTSRKKRLAARRQDPLKLLKTSKLDEVAQKKWKDYSAARDEMLMRTHTAIAPWMCVRADHKKPARLNVIRHLLHALAPADIAGKIAPPDPDVLFNFEEAALTDGRLAT